MSLAAFAAARGGDVKQARALLAEVRDNPADGGQAWFATGMLDLAQGDLAAAREAFLAAIAAAPLSMGDRARFGQNFAAAWPANRYAVFDVPGDLFAHEFCVFGVPAFVSARERRSYGVCMERACALLGDAAADVIARDTALNGAAPWQALISGHAAWRAGRRADADTRYAEARRLALAEDYRPDHFNQGIYTWLDASRAAGLAESDGPVIAADGPADLVIVVGCDGAYLAFLPKLLLSVVASHGVAGLGMRIVMHLHMAEMTARQEGDLAGMAAALAAKASLIRLAWSTQMPAARQAAFYTCLRFLVMPSLLDAYGAGVVALDVDCTITPAVFDIHKRMASHDVGLRLHDLAEDGRLATGIPWSIGAHPAWVMPTPAGLRFARFVRNYLVACYDPALPTCWTIDQCALAQAHDLLLRPDPSARVLNVARLPAGWQLPGPSGKYAFLDAGGRVTARDFSDRLSGRQAMPAAARDDATPASAPQTEAARVLSRFESLGGRFQGCEFGLVQRNAGIEPLGLFRWAETRVDELVAALNADLDGIGARENTVVEILDWGEPEYVSRDLRFGMEMHTWLKPSDVSAEEAFATTCRRLSFLARKLLEDLREAKKIFVYRETTRWLSVEEMTALHQAVSRFGGASLMVAGIQFGDFASGDANQEAPGLYGGHFAHFRVGPHYEPYPDVDDVWLQVCRNTLALDAAWRGSAALGEEGVQQGG